MKAKEFKDYIDLISSYSHTFIGLALMLVLSVILLLLVQGLIPEKINISLVTILLFFLVLIYWSCVRRLPRINKNKIGVVIAICTNDEITKTHLKNDFEGKIRTNFQNEHILENFDLVFLNNYYSEKIVKGNKPRTPLERIIKFNKKIRAHYFVFGEIKKVEELFVFRLNGVVLHSPVADNLRQDLSNDIAATLGEIEVLNKNQLRGFEASADMVHFSVKYIVGFAALLSGGFTLAEKLLSSLSEEFGNADFLSRNYAELKRKSWNLSLEAKKKRLVENHLNKTPVEKELAEIEYLLQRSPNDYQMLLLKAKHDFEAGNVKLAIRNIIKARNCAVLGCTWRYSLVFLLFWEGLEEKAIKKLKEIKAQDYEGDRVNAVESIDFCKNEILKSPIRTELNFIVGYYLYYKINDLAGALAALENFTSNFNPQYAKSYVIALDLIETIKSEMQIET